MNTSISSGALSNRAEGKFATDSRVAAKGFLYLASGALYLASGFLYVAKGFLALLFVVGVLVNVAHYLPQPEAAKSDANPLAEYVTQQLPLFDSIPYVSAAHVIPALVFMLLVGVQLLPGLRRKYPRFHRYNGRVLMICALIFTLSGLIIGFVMPFGGAEESLVNLAIAAMFLYFLFEGYVAIKQAQVTRHQIAMLRMVAVALTPVVMRIFFSPTVALFEFAPRDIFAELLAGACMLNLMVTQIVVLRIKRRHPVSKSAKQPLFVPGMSSSAP